LLPLPDWNLPVCSSKSSARTVRWRGRLRARPEKDLASVTAARVSPGQNGEHREANRQPEDDHEGQRDRDWNEACA
jgi:hypothetical protein